MVYTDKRGRKVASWVIREKGTGRVICETFKPATAAAINVAVYEAVPIGEYLESLNRQPLLRIPTPSPTTHS